LLAGVEDDHAEAVGDAEVVTEEVEKLAALQRTESDRREARLRRSIPRVRAAREDHRDRDGVGRQVGDEDVRHEECVAALNVTTDRKINLIGRAEVARHRSGSRESECRCDTPVFQLEHAFFPFNDEICNSTSESPIRLRILFQLCLAAPRALSYTARAVETSPAISRARCAGIVACARE